MDTENVDLFVKLLKEVEEFLESIDTSSKFKKSTEKDRKELLEKVQECHQKLSFQPDEYVDMSGYTTPAISTHPVDESFDGLDSPSGTTKEEQDIVEECNYEYSETLLSEEIQEVTPHVSEEQLNLADANPPSASELRAMAIKCGPLQRKDRFMFMEQFRRFWVALNGNRIYFYNNERDNKPQHWVEMANYTARSAPEAVRDAKKKSLCFELISPGNKALQLIARNPKDMEQWIYAINYRATKTDLENSSDQPATLTYENVDSQMEALQCSHKLNTMEDHKVEDDDVIYNDIQYTCDTENLYDDATGNGLNSVYERENLYDDVVSVRDAKNQLNNVKEETLTETAKSNKEPESVSGEVPFLTLRNRIELLNRS